MQHSGHIAIAGGGIIGLACALVLRRRGFEVSVFEASAAMQEASSAAGGMLAVEDPENPPALLPFSRYSRSLYDSFLEEIETLSGQRVPLRTRETVQILDVPPTNSAGVPLSREEARRLVPRLTVTGLPEADHNYRLLEEASLDPRDLCAALPLAVRAAGVALHEHERVLSATTDDHVLLTTTHRTVHADALVNCCGAWADSLDASAVVAPRKGQMLVVAQPDGPRLTRVLRSPDVYLIPRSVSPDSPISHGPVSQTDDRIVIGATVEDAGYSKLVEPAALAILRKRAAAVWAPAADALEVGSWAGLRPGSPDGLPIIGQIGRCEHGRATRFLATGHYRNGILLAPGTAHVIADLICGRTPAVDLTPFAAHRGVMATACDKHFAAAL